MRISLISKRGNVVGEVIAIFIVIFIISVLAGMTFLFTGIFKQQIATTSLISQTVINETGAWLNATPYYVSNRSALGFTNFGVINIAAANATKLFSFAASQYSVSSSGYVVNTTGNISDSTNGLSTNISYSYSWISNPTAYQAVNNTEQSGFQTTQFLTILFLAMMFSAIMAVVLKVVLPFMNVGGAMGF